MSSDDSDAPLSVIKTSKKKQVRGRISDTAKFIRYHTYETGENCGCKRFLCFEAISAAQRARIIFNFNKMVDRNAQNSYLCGLIGLKYIQRRRPRVNELEAKLRDYSYSYKVRTMQEDGIPKDIEVCQKAFLALHGIMNRRIMTLQKYLKTPEHSFHDMRGQHNNRLQSYPKCAGAHRFHQRKEIAL